MINENIVPISGSGLLKAEVFGSCFGTVMLVSDVWYVVMFKHMYRVARVMCTCVLPLQFFPHTGAVAHCAAHDTTCV